MRLKIKNPIMMGFLFIFSFFCLSLPYHFYTGTSLLEKKEYIWFLYFNSVFIFTILFIFKKNYFELIRAEIKDGNLVYYNFVLIKNTIKLSEIKGYKTGISDDGKDFVSFYTHKHKKLFILKDNYYLNIKEFVENMKIEDIGTEFTLLQRIILKIKGKK